MKGKRGVLLLLCLAILMGPFLVLKYHSELGIGQFTGPIGDTLGGLTAPFIGLLSAILVYMSFQEQVKANRLVQNQINEESFRSNLKDSQKKIESFNAIYISRSLFRFLSEIDGIIKKCEERFEYEAGLTPDQLNEYNAIYGAAYTFMENGFMFHKDRLGKTSILYGYVYHHYDYLLKNAQRAKIDDNYILLDFILLCLEEYEAFIEENFPLKPLTVNSKYADLILLNMRDILKIQQRVEQIKDVRIEVQKFVVCEMRSKIGRRSL